MSCIEQPGSVDVMTIFGVSSLWVKFSVIIFEQHVDPAG
jgi:hypothetical protein